MADRVVSMGREVKQLPKYVEKLLFRRYKLALELQLVCNKVDNYYNKHVPYDVNDATFVNDHVGIFCEPDVAYHNTREKAS